MVMSMLELWTLMDTPVEEQQCFREVASNIAASEDEITEPNSLSLQFLKNVRFPFFLLYVPFDSYLHFMCHEALKFMKRSS